MEYTVDPKRVQRRIEARQVVGELLTFVPDVLRGRGIDQDTFWEVLAEEMAARVAKRLIDDGPSCPPMNDSEAFMFSKSIIRYGTHKGKQVKDVDPSYWTFLYEGEFGRALLRYIRSPYFMRQQ